jgi:hypothetical protein
VKHAPHTVVLLAGERGEVVPLAICDLGTCRPPPWTTVPLVDRFLTAGVPVGNIPGIVPFTFTRDEAVVQLLSSLTLAKFEGRWRAMARCMDQLDVLFNRQ